MKDLSELLKKQVEESKVPEHLRERRYRRLLANIYGEAVSPAMASIEKSGVVKVIRANSNKLDRAGGPVKIDSNLDQAYIIHTKQWPRIKISLNGDVFDGTWVGDKRIWQVHQSKGAGKVSRKKIKDVEAVKAFEAIFAKASVNEAMLGNQATVNMHRQMAGMHEKKAGKTDGKTKSDHLQAAEAHRRAAEEWDKLDVSKGRKATLAKKQARAALLMTRLLDMGGRLP